MAKQFNFDDLPVVETKRGKLRGYQSEGTYIFKGIPYAKHNVSNSQWQWILGKESKRQLLMDLYVQCYNKTTHKENY